MNTLLEHLTPEDLDDIGRELDAIRDEVMADLGERDAAYIRKVVKVQRGLEGAGRAALLVSLFPPAWLAGTTALAVAKVLENMELGHNVMHGQWDWMRDPEIHSTTWEWDNVSAAEGWKKSHNYEHHTYTNIVGKDRDLGYTLLRLDADQPWKPFHLAQPLYNVVLAAGFQWGVALYDLELDEARKGRKPWSRVASDVGRLGRKAARQIAKDYVAWPLLSGPVGGARAAGQPDRERRAQRVDAHGHLLRALPRRRGDVRLRRVRPRRRVARRLVRPPAARLLQRRRPARHAPDDRQPQLPDRAPPVPGPAVQPLRRGGAAGARVCERYGLPYVSGPLPRQYAQVVRKILRMSLPGGGEAAADSDHARSHRAAPGCLDRVDDGPAAPRRGAPVERSAARRSNAIPGRSAAPRGSGRRCGERGAR